MASGDLRSAETAARQGSAAAPKQGSTPAGKQGSAPGAVRTDGASPTRRGSRTGELEEVLQRHEGERLVIFIKGYPDPDSIASALAHRHLCRAFGVDADIVHFERLSHHENRALVKRLEIGLTAWSDEVDLTQYSGYCCVDTPLPDLPIKVPESLPVVSLVDHHKSQGKIAAEFVDVREDAGSTCAVYCEYLETGSVGLDPAADDTVQIATALMYGIRSDTDAFILARPIDFQASAYLSPLVDRDLLRIVSEQSISAKSMDILQVALDKKIIKGNYLIAGVGYVRDEDRDGIAEAADYLLRREGVDTVLVYGIVGGAIIDGSLRTTSNAVDPDVWMKDLFGVDEKSGKYYGGGRRDKGGFQVPLRLFARCSDKNLLWQTVQCTVEDVFFGKIGASRDEG